MYGSFGRMGMAIYGTRTITDERLKARGGFDEGKIELDELESEDMDIYLLQKMKSRDMWSEFEQTYGSPLHPTFEEILDYYP